MRIAGILFIVLLLAVAVTMFLQVEDAKTSIHAVEQALPALNDPNTLPMPLDRREALDLCDELEILSRDRSRLADAIPALREAAALAAGWAAGSDPTSAEHLAAVEIRGAAGDLRQTAIDGSDRALDSARLRLTRAREALTVGATDPITATEALRSQIDDLEQRQRERQQELDEALNR